MTEIEKTWEAAKAERGKDAFKLFLWAGHNLSDNKDVEKWLIENNSYIQLKPLDKLVELDIQRYGKWAYLIYKNVSSNRHLLDMIHQDANGNDPIRKPYANVPFNIEWAKADVDVEWFNLGEWKKLSANEFSITHEWTYNNGKKVIQSNPSSCIYYAIDDLRHPFPPVKELGL